jgi:ABC-type antimicrobial peptide transport system permease subunit
MVSDHYFAALGIQLVEGRDFSPDDTPVSTKVAIVNESLARRYFRGPDPLGRYLRIMEGSKIEDAYEIIGVVKDAKYGAVREEMAPTLYITRNQDATALASIYFEVRAAAGRPDALITPLKSAVDRDISLQFTPLTERVTKSLSRERLLAALAGIFGNLALVLAMMGLYGVMSYNTARRRNEIAVRMALGSSRGRLCRGIMGEVAILIGAGLALGLVVAITTTRFLTTLLYGLKPNDPATLTQAAALLVAVGLLAGYWPARRASNSDIMMALRDE